MAIETDLVRAEALGQEGLALFQALDDMRGVADALDSLGVVAFARNDLAQAVARFETALSLARTLAEPGLAADILGDVAHASLVRGDLARARPAFDETLSLALTLANRNLIAWCVAGFAGLALVARDAEGAVRLFAAAAAIRAAGHAPLRASVAARYDGMIAEARAAMDPAAFAAAWTRGQRLTMEEAITEARAVASSMETGDAGAR
jgi:tetratricopeptide (TPR) repeat protein